MSPQNESEVIQKLETLAHSVQELHGALLGTPTNPNGALHTVMRLADDMYRPEDPDESLLKRVRKIEDREQRRTGLAVAAGFVGSAVVWLINLFISRK